MLLSYACCQRFLGVVECYDSFMSASETWSILAFIKGQNYLKLCWRLAPECCSQYRLVKRVPGICTTFLSCISF